VSRGSRDVSSITEAGDLEAVRRLLGHAAGQRAAATPDPFQLILVDLELPDGSGLELLSELANYPATRIVTTLYSDDEHLFPALQCGADGYLLKEDRFEVLVEELAMASRRPAPCTRAAA
jgi:two-component system, NarL family, nitrate/nitrite response regulator NarL